MKSFIKNVLSSCLGTFGALIIIAILGFIAMAGMVSFFSDMSNYESGKVKGEEVLLIELDEELPELTNNTRQIRFDLSDNVTVGSQDIIRLIEKAKTDEDIKGIVLDLKMSNCSYATASALRNALNDFKESGKFIYSYADALSQKQYYLASVADSVFLNPNGSVTFKGMGIMMPYFKNTLEMLDIKPEIYYVGNYKSATEPFRREDMSEEDRKQKRMYINSLFSVMTEGISESRNIPQSEVNRIADEFLIRNAEDAVEYKFVDNLIYYSDYIDLVKEKIGFNRDEKFSPFTIDSYYNKHKNDLKPNEGDEIAIVYAEGDIITTKGSMGQISDNKYVPLLRDIEMNKDIKGVILRVNSPGGSALASDNIWNQVERLRKAGKKVIVSMGTYAASGGYYISCNADYIYAEPTTMTGSIGVYGIFFNTNDFFNNKLGITFDTVQTGEFTNSFTAVTGRSEEAKSIIQNSVDDIYSQFKQRVADGRNMSIDEVEKIAQGRVYTGTKALELGLVDEIGGLPQAVAKMAEMLEIDKYDIDEYPKVKSPFEQLMKEFSNQQGPEKLTLSGLPPEYRELYTQLKKIKTMQGIQARTPYVFVE